VVNILSDILSLSFNINAKHLYNIFISSILYLFAIHPPLILSGGTLALAI